MKQNVPDFWNLVVRHGITLISRLESDKSEVDEATAQEFLVKVEDLQQAPSQDQDADLDDLD
jgi:hypothetical protein